MIETSHSKNNTSIAYVHHAICVQCPHSLHTTHFQIGTNFRRIWWNPCMSRNRTKYDWRRRSIVMIVAPDTACNILTTHLPGCVRVCMRMWRKIAASKYTHRLSNKVNKFWHRVAKANIVQTTQPFAMAVSRFSSFYFISKLQIWTILRLMSHTFISTINLFRLQCGCICIREQEKPHKMHEIDWISLRTNKNNPSSSNIWIDYPFLTRCIRFRHSADFYSFIQFFNWKFIWHYERVMSNFAHF